MQTIPAFRLALVLLATFFSPFLSAEDWPWWRGPDRNGVATGEKGPPIQLDAKKNLLWSVDLPGRSHGSPIIVADSVVLAVADEEKKLQSLHAFDRETGKPKWAEIIHENGMQQKSNKKASWASSTPASHDGRVFINFVSGDAAWTTALDLETGKQLWQKKICDYQIHQGYGSSPAIFEELVIVSADNKKGGAVIAFDQESGSEVWRVDRAKMPNYPSPILLEAAGKLQLFLTGTERVTSLDPRTGEILWEIEGATTECVTSTVTDGKHIYSSGGYPRNHVAAIAADGSGKIAWETKDRVYVPSMLIKGDYLYAVMDSGVGICWNAATGEEMWKARIGGTFSASPILIEDRIYAANEAGELTVFRASPNGLDVLGKSKVGDEVFASPTICDGRIYFRAAFYQGNQRTEKLLVYGE